MSLCKNGSYTLVWVGDDYNLMIPKKLTGMTKEKAIGSLNWTKRTMTKKYRYFVYDPNYFSIFNDDGSPNKEIINKLIKEDLK